MKIVSCLILFLFSLAGLYFGIGGAIKTENYNIINEKYDFNDTTHVERNGIDFANYAESELSQENEKALKWFIFIDIFPEWFNMILTACFFGLLGGVILIVKQIALDNINEEDTKFISIPLLGFFTGILTLGLVYLIPTILTENNLKIRPISLQFLSLFAGIYSTHFFDFLNQIVKSKIYRNEN